jgi:phosphohistidine phosphatase SixA
VKIFLVRHCFAGDPVTPKPGAPEPDPGLTHEGREAAAALASHMKDEGYDPTCVITSTFARARQTGKILSDKLGLGPVKQENGLGPTDHRGPTLSVVLKKYAADPECKRIIVVSHHDNIRQSLSALCHDEEYSVDPIAKGEMRVIDMNRKKGTWKEEHRCMPSELGFEDLY